MIHATGVGSDQSGLAFFGASIGNVTNSGTIIGGIHGTYFGGPNSTLLNTTTGVIHGGSGNGVRVNNASANFLITNEGLITGITPDNVNDAGVYFNAGRGDVVNTGTIIGGFKGVAFNGNVSLGVNTLINDSGALIETLNGGNANSGAVFGSAGGTTAVNVTNAGEIRGAHWGIRFQGSSTITNTGTISGVMAGISLTQSGFVDNAGIITSANSGVYTSASGTVFNRATGLITGTSLSDAAQAGVYFTSAAVGFLDNSGTIIGGIRGVNYTSTAGTNILVNNAGGLIQALATGDANGAAVVTAASAPLTLTNAGEIRGAVHGLRIGGPSTVVNTGTITGGNGIAIALIGTAASAVSTLELGNGSKINGNIVSAAAGLNTITLTGAGGMDGSIIGTSGNAALSVSTLTMNGADWTISGDVQLSGDTAAALNVTAGRLAIAGDTILANATGGVTIAAGGTLQIGNNTATGSLTNAALAGQPAIINNGVFAISRSDDIAITGAFSMSGTGDFAKAGTGSLDITGATMTSAGNTQVQEGKLITGVSNLLGNTLLGASGTLEFNQTVSGAYAGNITGAGLLIKEGAGEVTLTGANTYTGDTTVNAGTLTGNIGAGTLTVNSGATYDVGGGVTNFSLTGILGTGTVNLNTANLTFHVASGTGVFNFTGALTGGDQLIKTGAGVLVLQTAAALSGGAHIRDGTLRFADLSYINAPVTLGDAATLGLIEYTGAAAWDKNISLTGAGGGFSVVSGTQSIAAGATINGAGDFVKAGAGALDITAATMNNTGNTQVLDGKLITDVSRLKGVTTLGATTSILELNQAANATHAGNITGAGSLVKNGTGELALTGANTYAGATTVNAGLLTGNIGQGTLTVNSGATYKVADGITNFTLSGILGNGTIDLNASGLNFNVAAGVTDSFNFSGALISSNPASVLIKSGAGTLVLLSNANLGGGAAIQDGVLALADQSLINAPVSIGAAATQGFINYTGASAWTHNLTLEGQGGGFIVGAGATTSLAATTAISGAGDFLKTGSGTLDITAATAAAHSGDVQVLEGTLRASTASLRNNAAISEFATLEFNQDTDAAHSGNITGDGRLVKTGTGSLLLTGAGNNYTGGTEIRAGILAGTTTSLVGDFAINAGAMLAFDQAADGVFDGIISGSGTIGKTGPGKLTLTGAYNDSPAIAIEEGTLQGSADNLRGNIALNSPSTTVVFDQSANADYAGIISGAGSFVKTGTGVLTFTATAAHSYSGATRITAGALRLAASNQLSPSSAIMLVGGTLGLGKTAQQARSLSSSGGLLEVTAGYNPVTALITEAGKLSLAEGISGDIRIHVTFEGNFDRGGLRSVTVIDTENPGAANYSISYENRAVAGASDLIFIPETGMIASGRLSAEVPSALVIPTIARLMGKAGIDTLQERLGDLRNQRSGKVSYSVRGIYREDELRGNNVMGGLKVRTTGAQAIVSWPVTNAIDPAKGRLDMGLLATAVRSDATYRGISDIESHAKEGGIFVTLMRGAWYGDLLANFSHNVHDVKVYDPSDRPDRNDRFQNKGIGPSVSFETGANIDLGKGFGTLQPQIQFIYQHHRLEDSTDNFKRDYTFGSTNSRLHRASLLWHGVFQMADGARTLVPYVRVSVGKEYAGEQRLVVAGERFACDMRNTIETALECGATLRISDDIAFYGSAGWGGNNYIRSVTASGGIRWRW